MAAWKHLRAILLLPGTVGDDYLLYKQNVPRWIPRMKPWEGLASR